MSIKIPSTKIQVGSLSSWIRYSQRQAWSLILHLDGALEVLISAELLWHKSYSLVAYTLCYDSHKSLWRRSLPNTCEVGWFNYLHHKVDFPSVLLMAHVQGHLKRAWLLGWETDVRLCLFSQLLISHTSPHRVQAAGESPSLNPSKGGFKPCLRLPGAEGTGCCL